MIKKLGVLAILILALAGIANASNYMYEKSSLKGTGYKNAEKIISTQTGFNGSKLVEKESGSGNIILPDGAYDQKWTDKLCVQNYKIGAVLTEMYSHAEHLQETTEVRTRNDDEEVFFNISAEEKWKRTLFRSSVPFHPLLHGSP